MFTEGTVTSVTTTATGTTPIEQTRERLRRGPEQPCPHRVAIALLALLAYVPLLVTRIGAVALDSNDGVYLDTQRTLRLAGGRWDPGLLFGSVIDRTDGYAFPMAPWFASTRWLHIPMWLSQRLWLGTILFLAGLGILVMLRTMRWEGTGAISAALAYMLSPYAMQYLGTRSVILLAWAGLPWLIHFAARSISTPGWSDPARFALVVALASGGNLAATLYMLVAPLLWYVFVGVVTREVSAPVLGRAMTRTAILTSGVCAWLIVGWTYAPRIELSQALSRDPREAVAKATVPSEVIRGAGDWRMYQSLGRHFGADIYWQWPILIALTTIVAAIGLGALAMTRFRNRLYFIGLLIAGMGLSVGAGPAAHRESAARIFNGLSSTSLGSVLVPTSRAIPLHSLALAVAFGAAVRALIRARPATWWGAQLIAGAVVAATVPALFIGRSLDSPMLLTDGIPGYWRQAALAVNGLPDDLNVLELPGQDSASYIWGTTNRPISASLFDRPVGLRTTPVVGQRPTRDVLAAIDDSLRNHTLEPWAIAPLARVLAVGAIIVRTDDVVASHANEALRVLKAAASTDLGIVKLSTFGNETAGTGSVSVFRVTDVAPRLRVYGLDDLAVGAADGRGLVDLANARLLNPAHLLVSAGSLDGPSDLSENVTATAPILITDANRLERRATRGEEASVGATEALHPSQWGGPTGERLTPRPGEPVGAAAHTELAGATAIISTSYGAATRFEPADRPPLAFDGDYTTGWRVGRGGSPIGERIVIELPQPVTADTLTLHQGVDAGAGRRVTAVHIEFDGFTSQDEVIGDPVAGDAGSPTHQIKLKTTTFRTLSIEIVGVAPGEPGAGAGFTEIEIAGVAPVTETIALPDTLLRFGDRLTTHPVSIVMTRWRDEAHGNDPEREIRRSFALPTSSTFEITGSAHALTAAATIPTGCQPSLVTIAGQPIGVHLAPTSDGQIAVTGCEPVTIEAGSVSVATARLGGVAGREIIIDRLILQTAPATVAPGTAGAVGPTPEPPRVELQGTTQLTIKTAGASTGVWVFRAAGASEGWTATLDDTDVDRSFLANGFGLAWPLEVGDGAWHQVTLRIPAQRRVSIAVIASTVAGLIAVALASRRRRSPDPIIEASRPLPVRAPRLSPAVVIMIAVVVVGVAGGAVPALTVGTIALGIDYRRSISRWTGWGSTVLLSGVGIAKAVWQITTDTPLGLDWPGATPVFDVLTWTAIAAAVAVGIGTASTRVRARPTF